MGWMSKLRERARDFAIDRSGTAGLEFVTTVPLLLGVLVFTSEYGEALRSRMALDSAVQDIGRYLARAPVDLVQGQPPTIAFYEAVENEAQALLAQRVDRLLSFEVATYTVDTSTFRDPYYVVEIRASSWEPLPLLAVINIFSDSDPADEDGGDVPLGLVMDARHLVRWVGGAPPGDADCELVDRYQGNCP